MVQGNRKEEVETGETVKEKWLGFENHLMLKIKERQEATSSFHRGMGRKGQEQRQCVLC